MLRTHIHRVFATTASLILLFASMRAEADQIRWAPNFEVAQQAAMRQGKLMLIHFWGPNCPPCRKVDSFVFPSPSVAQTIHENFIPLRVNGYENQKLRSQFGVDRWPTDIIATPDGRVVQKMVTPQDPRKYVNELTAIAMTQSPRASSDEQTPFGTRTQASFAGTTRQPESTTSFSDVQNRYASTEPSVPAASPVDGTSRFELRPQTQFAAQNQQPQQSVSPQVLEPLAVNNRFASGATGADDANSVQTEITNPYVHGATPGNQHRNIMQQQPAGNQFVGPAAPQSGRFAAQHQNEAARQSAIEAGTPEQRPSPSRFEQAPNQRAMANQRPNADVGPIRPEPENQPTIGLDGRCPVTLVTKRIWQKGEPKYGAVHRGHVYLFTGPEEQRMFLADPDAYSPVLAGMDVVRLAVQKRAVPGDRRFGVLFDSDGNGPEPSRIYLFDSELTRNQFEADGWREHHLQPIFQAMEQGRLDQLLR